MSATQALYFAVAICTTCLAGGSFAVVRFFLHEAWGKRPLARYLILLGIVVPATAVFLGTAFASLAFWYGFFNA